jgi:hypothetical protein
MLIAAECCSRLSGGDSGSFVRPMIICTVHDPLQLIRSLVIEIWTLCCNQIILYNNPRVYTGLSYL